MPYQAFDVFYLWLRIQLHPYAHELHEKDNLGSVRAWLRLEKFGSVQQGMKLVSCIKLIGVNARLCITGDALRALWI